MSMQTAADQFPTDSVRIPYGSTQRAPAPDTKPSNNGDFPLCWGAVTVPKKINKSYGRKKIRMVGLRNLQCVVSPPIAMYKVCVWFDGHVDGIFFGRLRRIVANGPLPYIYIYINIYIYILAY